MKVGDVIDGKYLLQRLLGEGGMGSVFEARHQVTGQRLALKSLHPDLAKDQTMVQRLIREAQAASAGGNDHIVFITDAGQAADGSPYLVMEYLEGSDVEALIRREGRLEPRRAVGLLLQVCQALAAAHGQGIVHRDLKPANLFVTQRDRLGEWVKILDFGIAKFSTNAAGQPGTLTKTGSILGTPYYMAPEQFRKTKDVDHRADVYSCGVILYQMLSGKVPFEADTPYELIGEVLTGTPPPLGGQVLGLDPGLEAVVMHAIAREPEQRIQGVAQLAEALSPFEGGGPRAGAPATWAQPSPPLPQTWPGSSLPATMVSTGGAQPPRMLPVELSEVPQARSRTPLYIAGAVVIALVLVSTMLAMLAAKVWNREGEGSPAVTSTVEPVPPPAPVLAAPTVPSVFPTPAGAQDGGGPTDAAGAFGYGGLGLKGTGGGGGTGEGTIGLGDLNTIGHGGGGGSGSGYGRGTGSSGGQRVVTPTLLAGTASVRGSLSKEVIRRSIRRSINQIRFCYEQQLAQNPSLAGRVSIRFVISPAGSVTTAAVAENTLGDPQVGTCVAQAVQRITFPEPEGGGVVIVTYPFMFRADSE